MSDPFEELEACMAPLMRKHPEAVTPIDVIDLQRACRHTFRWCRELSEWNERATESLTDANMMLEVMLPDG